MKEMKEKQEILKRLFLRTIFFFIISFLGNFSILSFAVAEGVSLIDTLRTRHSHGQKDSARERYAKAMRACHGIKMASNKWRKVVALTFDDGPNGKYTREILDILRLNDIKATFFFVGKNIEEQQDIVRRAFIEGHVIANHSYSHNYLTKLPGYKIEWELSHTNDLIEEIIGRSPLLFRPPYGLCSKQSARIAEKMGFTTVMWSSVTEDYNYGIYPNVTSEYIADEILKLVTPGAIINLHDGGGNRAGTVEALPEIIYELKRQGYEFLTIPELLEVPAYLRTYVERLKKEKPRKLLAKKRKKVKENRPIKPVIKKDKKMTGEDLVKMLLKKYTIHVLQAKDLTLR